ncbi:MAG: 50S ribosomal protein L22 [Verrucomicrobiales bacterium]|nr:50S ribosomal protein L22 [Verrucomicrobiales bacterium]|tara:strand:- start:216 stop:878 length:663 start_codon:yes stop_codon:yes gene_type:complete
MDVTSTYKFARISARKARDVAREIQGLPVSEALDILNFTPRKGAELFGKTLKTALADAENNFELAVDGLYVKSAVVGEGPTFKRFKARARGSASAIMKRTSHITVVLSDDEMSEKAGKKAPAPKKVEKKAEKAAPEREKVDESADVAYDSAPAESDDLKKLTGVGPKLAEKLNAAGVTTYEQISSWSEDEFNAINEEVSLKGIELETIAAEAKALQKESK